MGGNFIVIEGGEGSGKGMCIDHLKKHLGTREDIVFTREPGGTGVAEAIRKVVLDKSHKNMLPLTEIFLFCGARAQHVNELIIPALESGRHVICDRFDFSTLAYQIHGWEREDLEKEFRELNTIAKSGINPDHVILIDVTAETGLKRKHGSEDGICTRFDEQDIEFHRRIKKSFFEQYRQSCIEDESIWHIVPNETATPEETKEAVLSIVKKIIRK